MAYTWREKRTQHHTVGCWVDGGPLRPSRCVKCFEWTADRQLETLMRRLENWAEKKGRI